MKRMILRTSLLILFPAGSLCFAQSSSFSVRFYDLSYNQQDRIRFQIDDNTTGPDASTRADIGTGSFTIEFWVKGTLAENNTAGRGPGDFSDFGWITGNIIFDRDIYGPDSRDFGISIKGGQVEFGTGDANGADPQNTLVSSSGVLDGNWHHVAVTRDVSDGRKRIFIDAILDATSAAGRSTAELSYPNDGVSGQVAPCGRGPWGNYLMIGKEKHDVDESEETCGSNPNFLDFPGFSGWVDEIRLWTDALSGTQVTAIYDRVIDPASYPDLAAYWRLEEGTGTVINDEVTGGTTGELIAGTSGNGEWSTDTAPVSGTASVGNWAAY